MAVDDKSATHQNRHLSRHFFLRSTWPGPATKRPNEILAVGGPGAIFPFKDLRETTARVQLEQQPRAPGRDDRHR